MLLHKRTLKGPKLKENFFSYPRINHHDFNKKAAVKPGAHLGTDSNSFSTLWWLGRRKQVISIFSSSRKLWLVRIRPSPSQWYARCCWSYLVPQYLDPHFFLHRVDLREEPHSTPHLKSQTSHRERYSNKEEHLERHDVMTGIRQMLFTFALSRRAHVVWRARIQAPLTCQSHAPAALYSPEK
jgi:hypothetical protein